MKRDPSGIFASNPPSAMFGVFSMITVVVIGMLVAIAIPNLLAAVQRGRQKMTMESMHRIGNRLEQLKGSDGYPVFRSLDALISIDGTLPVQDGWDHPFRLSSDADAYYLASAGKDGRFEQNDLRQYQSGLTQSVEEDIVYGNGRFIRRPEAAKE